MDYVFPDVPVRQWVLTLPSRVRYALAWDHALCRAVVAVFVRAVLGWYRRHARRTGVSNGRGGAVVIVQRFGSGRASALRMSGATWGSPARAGRNRGSTRADKAPPTHLVAREVSANLGCNFAIQDDEEQYWDFTYEARIYDPDDNQIGYGTSWVSDKMSFSSNYTKTVADPPEGLYKCSVQWWVNNTQLPLQWAQFNLSYLVPTSETTTSLGWPSVYPYRSAHAWKVTLNHTTPGVSFKGRYVSESFGGSVSETCHFSGSNIPEMRVITLLLVATRQMMVIG